MKNTKKSFFREYFLYKFRSFGGLTAAAVALNTLSAALPGIFLFALFGIYYAVKTGNIMSNVFYGMTTFLQLYLMAVIVSVAALTIIMAIVPAVSFKFYNDRASMDTIGGLPLTYRERFWGDFLGGLCPNLITFIPSAAVGAVFTAIAQNGPMKEVRKILLAGSADTPYLMPTIKDNITGVYLAVMLIIFMGYLTAYVISSFVTSCCGKTSSSVVYSFIAMLVPAGVTSVFGTFILSNAAGVLTELENMDAISVFAPVGTWMSLYMRLTTWEGDLSAVFFMIKDPPLLILQILIAGAFLAGAYFLGKYRKAERVDRDFVYGSVYHVIACTLSAVGIGFFFTVNRQHHKLEEHIVWFFVMLVFYAAVELLHTRSFKKLWRTALRFIGIYAACAGVLMLSDVTRGFGISYVLPPRGSISEAVVSGQYFYSDFYGKENFVYNSDSAVSAIYEEHKKLLDGADELSTGYTLMFTYKLKTGAEFTRTYSLSDAEAEGENSPLKQASDRIKALEPANADVLGFLDDPVYDDIDIRVSYHSGKELYVSDTKTAEFLEILRGDVINHYGEGERKGIIAICYKLNGADHEAFYAIDEGFGSVEEFLSRPENTTQPSSGDSGILTYHVTYNASEDDTVERLNLKFNSDDASEALKEFKGYLVESDEGVDIYSQEFFEKYSSKLSVFVDVETDASFFGASMYIEKKNEEAALDALLRYIQEKITAK